jgi:hypothetical protein
MKTVKINDVEVELVETAEDLKIIIKKTYGDKYDKDDEAYAEMAFEDVPDDEIMVLEGWTTVGHLKFPLLNGCKKAELL